MPEELKPCPFCGGVAKIMRPPYGGSYAWVQCQGECLTESPGANSVESAIADWNRRSPSPLADRLADALMALMVKAESAMHAANNDGMEYYDVDGLLRTPTAALAEYNAAKKGEGK